MYIEVFVNEVLMSPTYVPQKIDMHMHDKYANNG